MRAACRSMRFAWQEQPGRKMLGEHAQVRSFSAWLAHPRVLRSTLSANAPNVGGHSPARGRAGLGSLHFHHEAAETEHRRRDLAIHLAGSAAMHDSRRFALPHREHGTITSVSALWHLSAPYPAREHGSAGQRGWHSSYTSASGRRRPADHRGYRVQGHSAWGQHWVELRLRSAAPLHVT